MAASPLNRLLARARFALANPDWLLLAGSLLVLLAALTQLLVLPAREAAVVAGERHLAQLERNTRRLQISRQSPAEQGRLHWLERFPGEAGLPGELGRLLGLAEDGGLQLSTGEYRLLAGQERLLDRYVVSLPVRGDYRQIRRFLEALRSEFPGLAIEDVSLRRDSIGVAEIEGQLRLAIFVRRGETP